MTAEISPSDSSSQPSAPMASTADPVQPSEEFVNGWYVALYEEDSRRLKELLDEHPSLWKVGWESDSERKVRGRPRNYWMELTESEWKGRTALHVGARRGNVDLLRKVLDLCRDETRAGVKVNRHAPQPNLDRLTLGREVPRGESDLEEDQRDSVVSSASVVGDRDFMKGLLLIKDEEESKLDGDWEERSMKRLLSTKNEAHKLDGDEKFMERLLLIKDGEYKLDAIAMAVVNGNKEVISVVLEAGEQIGPVKDKYKIEMTKGTGAKGWSDEPNSRSEISESESEMRIKLRSATQDIMGMYELHFNFGIVVRRRYDRHRDFNFLPFDEYLLHFLFTDYDSHESNHLFTSEDRRKTESSRVKELYVHLRHVLIKGVIDVSSQLWSFLWALEDGQGRPPLHVAVDDGLSASHVTSLLLGLGSADESADNKEAVKEAVVNALDVRDGIGRNFLHRPIASGGENSMHLLGSFGFLDVCYFESSTEFKDSCFLSAMYSDGTWAKIFQNFKTGCFAWDQTLENMLYQEIFNVVPKWRTSRSKISYTVSLDNVSNSNGFPSLSRWMPVTTEFGRTSLHSAIIHKNARECEMLLYTCPLHQRSDMLNQRIAFGSAELFGFGFTVNCWELAAIIGDVQVLERLLFQPGHPRPNSRNHFSALHLAAALGKYDVLQLFTNDTRFDPLKLDESGNSALHYATEGMSILERAHVLHNKLERAHVLHNKLERTQVLHYATEGMSILERRQVLHYYATEGMSILGRRPVLGVHMMDNVHCEQILKLENTRTNDAKDRSARELLNTEKARVERQACINLLIQKGCDIFKPNWINEFPYPSNDADPKFHSWWHEKHAKEFGTAQSARSIAANAISVTAALVATASYVGPLQPPLGYNDNDPTELRLGITAVKVFIICDTMSFYLAISAIISALIPCLPMPQQSMTDELRRTRYMLNAAVTMLFPSIICILIAFAAATIAIIQTNQMTWNRGGLTIGTASVGGFICLIFIGIFSIRVLATFFHNSKRIRFLYEIIAVETLVSALGKIVLSLALCLPCCAWGVWQWAWHGSYKAYDVFDHYMSIWEQDKIVVVQVDQN